jgi:hypothetical protein
VDPVIDNRFHIKLNGVKYRLFELDNGGHYHRKREPLRPPNSVVEQGGDPQAPRYQTRPDILVWTIDDWSGGEGQIRCDPQSPSRAWRLNAVDPFIEPGKLMPGPYLDATLDSGGVNPFALSLAMSVSAGVLWGVDMNATNAYYWSTATQKWSAAVALVGPAAGSANTAWADNDYIYWKENNSDNVYRTLTSGAYTCTIINTDTLVTSREVDLVGVGNYLYLMENATGKVWELAKSGAFPVASTLIDDPSDQAPDMVTAEGTCLMCAGDNRVYTVLSWTSGHTAIREITPTSAAGTGFGQEIAHVTGFIAESIWYHAGMLYLSGYEDTYTRSKRCILYVQPGGEYGTMGRLRQGSTLYQPVLGGAQGQRMLDMAFLSSGIGSTYYPALWLLDAVSGGIALYGFGETLGFSSASAFHAPLAHDGQFFMTTAHDAVTKRVIYTNATKFESDDAYSISPWQDFGLVEAKVLQSLRLHCEALPANWTITLSYAIDGSDSFTSAGTYTTTSGTGTTLTVSTSSSVKEFRTLRIKIAMTCSTAAPTTRPKILGVEVRASVDSIGPRLWKLLLDCHDEHAEGGRSFDGKTKILAVETAYAADVVELLDGYYCGLPNVYSTHYVTMDDYDIDLERPGEGAALVTLREVQ